MADISPSATFPSSHCQSRSPPSQDSRFDSAAVKTNKPRSRRRSLPFVLPPVLQKNTSSTFLIPSTAEGKPVPLDGSTASHRTTALRQLNRSQPSSRHRYTKSSEPPGTKSTATDTYSRPVVVRTYSGASPSSSVKGPVSVSTATPLSNPPVQYPRRNGTVNNNMRYKASDRPRLAADAKLPPLEAFSFKSIMADIQQDVGADLDRIAEICARSRYSLSNQYEVHIAPLGSGSDFARPSKAPSRPIAQPGPTLQATSNDDEHIGLTQKKRRSRRSAAYGTLETIMGSSRSSDEDRSKKKSAAEIMEEVRGRGAETDNGEGVGETSIEAQVSSHYEQEGQLQRPSQTAPFATVVVERSKRRSRSGDDVPIPATMSGAALHSGLAKPQTSRNYLETRTLPEGSSHKCYIHTGTPPRPSQAVACESVTASSMALPRESTTLRGTPSITGRMFWRDDSVLEIARSDVHKQKRQSSYAEGTLREILKLTSFIANHKSKQCTLP
ncbi:hypothetical protein GGR52DRAFT_557278 [Hypoxylon sp. FL1284]|nr:hypothetical protein GGR52DRAFT_557278 [Hypoxylon sp. FL1284]